jgi:hypothetical protein
MQEESFGIFSNGSLGLNMSFGNLFGQINENQEKKVKQEFVTDMILLVIVLVIIQMIRLSDPQGCGIPLREWLMIFFILYFSRSLFQLIRIYIERY